MSPRGIVVENGVITVTCQNWDSQVLIGDEKVTCKSSDDGMEYVYGSPKPKCTRCGESQWV